MKMPLISLLCAVLLLVEFHRTAAASQAVGSCNFEVYDPQAGNNFCGYAHETEQSEDFVKFDLRGDSGNRYMGIDMDKQPGQKARFYSIEIRQQDTHCYTFQYHLEGGVIRNNTISSNVLNVYVLDAENKHLLMPVWTSTLEEGSQNGWTTVQLALNPRAYQVVFEAEIVEPSPGVIALDNIIVTNKACVSTPHFLRVGNKEVNAGQDVTLRCLLWGKDLAWWERNETSPVVLQKYAGKEFMPTSEEVFDDHLSIEFTFPQSRPNLTGKYRCVSRNATSVGVSNFANVSVKIPPVPLYAPSVKTPGSTQLLIQLNNESFAGDKPIIQTILSYRPVDGSWSELHEIKTSEYLLYHLQPDTMYEIRVKLVRPGPGGMGDPGPASNIKTQCGAPLLPVQNVKPHPIASTDIRITWEVPDFSVTQCHYHTYEIKYRKYSPDDNSTSFQFDTLAVETGDFGTVTGLQPATKYEIKVKLINSFGSIETGTYTVETGEGVPGRISQESFVVTDTTETSISLKWVEPEITNGNLTQYEIAYRGMSSFQPDFTPQQDTGLYQIRPEERNVTIEELHPGTNYTFMIRAQTRAGFGLRVEVMASTKIAAPKMPVYPSPTPDDGLSSTPTTIEIDILPAEANGGPISFYYIVIEEVADEGAEPESRSSRHRNGARSSKKRKKNRRRQKRSADAIFQSFVRAKRQTEVTTVEEPANACYSEPISYEEAKRENKPFYVGGKLAPESVTEGTKYVVGGGTSAGGFSNPPLDPNKKYRIYVRVESEVDGETKVNCALVAIKASVPPTTPVTSPPTTTPVTTMETTKSVKKPDTVGTSTLAPQTDSVIMYAGIGGGIVIVLIFIVIVVVFLNTRRKGKTKRKDEVVNPFEVRMMMSDMVGTGNHHSIPRSFGNPDRQALMMPDVVDFENHDFMEKTLDASGTRVSDTFRSGSMPPVEDRPALRVDDFHIHVNDLKRQNNFGFHEEFTSFREGQQAPWEVGKREENRPKNRYGNIVAYDHSRVVLEPMKGQGDQPQTDYINANYVMGYKSPEMYIAAQAPSADTVNDFWTMIWQERCPVVVMVTNLVELGKRKCHKYWPDETAQFGTVKVSLTDTEELSDYTIRTFVIQQNDDFDVREVKQFHFTSWPDHGVPSHPTTILSFVRRVKSYEPPGRGPTIVHCSAGSGRTGCFIVIDMMLDMAREENVIDIYNTVTDLRNRRVNMVQTEEQYIFIHEAVLEALLCVDTLVAAQDLRQHYDDLITVDQHTQIAPVQEEFETLNVMTPKLSEDECSVARLPRNRQRNRFMDVLPSDRQMPYLVTPHPTDPDSNYINAIFADSYSKRNTFIVTQMPLPNTVIDFWRLVYDYDCSSLVMMNDSSEHDQTCSQYWPDNGSALFGPFTVELVQKEDEVDVVSRLFKLQNINKPSEGYRFVKQFQLTNWPATQPVPYTRNAVLRVIQLVTKWQKECAEQNHGRILVHCVAGAGRSGTFVACYNLCMQLRNENAADVFNIVQRLRNVRPQLVETLEQYRFCYEVGWDFADQ